MLAILFGLSMDYQVFLVSRMHEEWLNTNDNEEAIVRGQANTGRVITAAALIMICVFFSFAFGGQRIIAEFGIGPGRRGPHGRLHTAAPCCPVTDARFRKGQLVMPKWLNRVVPHLASRRPKRRRASSHRLDEETSPGSSARPGSGVRSGARAPVSPRNGLAVCRVISPIRGAQRLGAALGAARSASARLRAELDEAGPSVLGIATRSISVRSPGCR